MVDQDPDEPRPALLARGGTTVVLLVLCLVLAGLGGVLWWRGERPDRSVPSGPVTSPSAARSGLAAVPRLTERVLSYGWKDVGGDVHRAHLVSTPSFRQQYDRTIRTVLARTKRDHVTLTARVVDAAVVQATGSRVQALVFVDQTTTARGAGDDRVDQNRVLVTVTRDGGEWRVSAMDAF